MCLCVLSSQALEPVYQQLADKYKNDNHVLIAKFDATANDAPDNFQFSGKVVLRHSQSVILDIILFV